MLWSIRAARAGANDPGGITLIQQSIEASRILNTTELVRGLNNLGHQLVQRGQLTDAEPVFEEMNNAARRFGYSDWIRWAKSKKLGLSYFLGRWEEAQELADELISEIDQGLSHYLEGEWRMYRSRIRLARGHRDAAMEDAKAGLAAAREAGDPQIVGPLVAWNARLLGSTPEAHALFDELMDMWLASGLPGAATGIPDGAAVAFALGRKQQFIDAATTIGGGPWLQAGVAHASGELSRAAEILAEIGARPEEASARLAAASRLVDAGQRSQAESELRLSLAVWRSVGATAYIREGEALLAACAQSA
jgi:tetratricopeptide (TPR) repeat protein